MPFTPFHFGPGLLVKGLAPGRFSWTTFAAAQVLIDCETLYHILKHEYPLHRGLHTFIGATSAGLATAILFLGLRRLAPGPVARLEASSPFLKSEVSTAGILAGGLVGGASHPFLDGLMHGDVRPFAPWSDANPLLGTIGLGSLHLACFAAAMAGVTLLWARSNRNHSG
ncbi:MAG: hypothetical protein HYV14_05600 [Elusimicrobia bacterium]|nr:hypothetical protein [Elusimicrobiota bacterium]